MLTRLLNLRSMLTLALALFVAVGLTGCDSNGANEEQNVEFLISTVPVTLQGNQAGIQFYAKATEDIELISVKIKSPVNDMPPFSAGRELFIKDELFGLQAADEGHLKISGEWTFTFTGNYVTGSKESFTKTVKVNVSA